MFDQAGFAGSGLTAHHRCLTVLTVSTCIDGISFTRVDEAWLRRHGTRFFDCLHIPSTMFSPSTFRKLPYITSSLVSNPPAAKATNAAGDPTTAGVPTHTLPVVVFCHTHYYTVNVALFHLRPIPPDMRFMRCNSSLCLPLFLPFVFCQWTMLENVTVAAAPKATAETGAVGVALKLDAIWVGGSAFRSIDTRGASSSSSSFVAVTIRRARVFVRITIRRK